VVPDPGLTPEEPGVGESAFPQPLYPPAPYPQAEYPVPPGYPPAPPGYPLVPPYPAAPGHPPVFVRVPKPEPLPVELREYHQFYRAPANRWWKPLVAILMFAAIWVLSSIVPVGVAMLWDYLHTGALPKDESALGTPAMFVANNVSVALAIPAAVLSSWAVYRQRPRWLSSIVGHFRWTIFWRFMAIAGGVMAVAAVFEAVLSGGFGQLSWNPYSLFLILSILITTPFQAAGEEYGTRGLVARSVGSWFSNRWVGLVVSILVSSVVFMLLHGAGEPWLNAYYLLVGVTFSVLVWRTGGLEAAIALHVCNNLVSEFTLPFSPDAVAHLFERQAGSAGVETLIPMGVTALVAGLLLWQSSRLGLPRATAPAGPAE
jgi:membrane protease YdiL (CAAX protease family)